MRALALILALGLVLGACSTGPGEDDVVSAMTGQGLVPAIEDAAAIAEDLAGATEQFCGRPTAESHVSAKQSWQEAKTAWEKSELTTFFGPADMLRTVSKVDYSPISETGIDDLLASETPIDADYIDDRASSTQRGLGAIEYGLYRDLDAASDPRVCQLTTSASQVVALETGALHEAWTDSFDGEAPFVDTFTGTMTSNQALADVVAAIVETLKRQSLFELGKALGISSPEPEIEAIPEGTAGAGAAMYLAQLGGIRAALEAGGPDSLAGLIGARSVEVAERIDVLLGQAIGKLTPLQGSPMRSVAEERPDDLRPLYDDLAELRTLFESDVVSLLDITLGFSDTDGDTG